jgi:hypothetical protein
MKYSTLKIIFENLHFSKPLVIKFLNNKDLFKKLLSNMEYDSIIGFNVLPKNEITKLNDAIKDMQLYLESL